MKYSYLYELYCFIIQSLFVFVSKRKAWVFTDNASVIGPFLSGNVFCTSLFSLTFVFESLSYGSTSILLTWEDFVARIDESKIVLEQGKYILPKIDSLTGM